MESLGSSEALSLRKEDGSPGSFMACTFARAQRLRSRPGLICLVSYGKPQKVGNRVEDN